MCTGFDKDAGAVEEDGTSTKNEVNVRRARSKLTRTSDYNPLAANRGQINSVIVWVIKTHITCICFTLDCNYLNILM